MKTTKGLLAASALLVSLAAPALADMDVPSLTCADFAAFDDATKLNAATDLMIWVNDSANATAAGSLVNKYGAPEYTGEAKDMVVEIEGHCVDAPPSETVVTRLQEHS